MNLYINVSAPSVSFYKVRACPHNFRCLYLTNTQLCYLSMFGEMHSPFNQSHHTTKNYKDLNLQTKRASCFSLLVGLHPIRSVWTRSTDGLEQDIFLLKSCHPGIKKDSCHYRDRTNKINGFLLVQNKIAWLVCNY